jgi:hypothetical protein
LSVPISHSNLRPWYLALRDSPLLGKPEVTLRLRIPINSPVYSDLISPRIPISNRPGDAVVPAR